MWPCVVGDSSGRCCKGTIMGKRVFSPRKMPKVSRENEDKIFDGRRDARLGTEKNPAQVSVATAKREAEIRAVCEERGWVCSITLEPDKPEDVNDYERLLNPPRPVVSGSRTGRNEACPCGSGKKFKKCCAA